MVAIHLEDEEANSQLEVPSQRVLDQRKDFEKRLEGKRVKITAGDDLAPGVLKMVKVYLAVKRTLCSLATRWPAVTATRVSYPGSSPVEDMPYHGRRHAVSTSC
jgi:DNA-directed RNA polymerase subunit beta